MKLIYTLFALILLTGLASASVTVGPGTTIQTTNVTINFTQNLTFDSVVVKATEVDFNTSGNWSNASWLPNNPINVTISSWATNNTYQKTWTESSIIPSTTTEHIFSGFPHGFIIAMYRDGTYFNNTTLSDGTLDWTYSTGYNSPHTFNFSISTSPVASFTSNVTSGLPPFVVSFTDTSSNGPTSWLWDFGDGTNSTSQNPVHVYTRDGTYNVVLSVSNSMGNSTSSQSGYVTSEPLEQTIIISQKTTNDKITIANTTSNVLSVDVDRGLLGNVIDIIRNGYGLFSLIIIVLGAIAILRYLGYL